MKRLLGFMLTVFLAACGGERPVEPDAAKEPSTSTTATAATQGDAGQFDLQFIDAMRKHHAMAVSMARVAAERAADVKIREIGSKMAEDQTMEIARLEEWRRAWFGEAPEGDLSQVRGASSMQMDMGHMQSLRGAEFDRMFADMMIPHHEGAVAMSCDAVERSSRQELRDFAREVIRKQEHEISELSAWQSIR